MATSVSEERSTFVGGLSCLCLFIIILCKGSYGVQVEWRCAILGIDGLKARINT